MRILVTCFEPYDEFLVNASQEAMRIAQHRWEANGRAELAISVEWRTLPVDFDLAPQALLPWLDEGFDTVLHLGQAPGSGVVQLEKRGVNAGWGPRDSKERTLAAHGPTELNSTLPLELWAEVISATGIPCQVSHDAGRYLCNAVLYHSLYYAQSHPNLEAAFIHLPFTAEQASDGTPFLPVEDSATAVLHCLELLRS